MRVVSRKPIPTQLDTMDDDEVRQLAFDCLTKVLTKVSLSEAARLLNTSNVTIMRWLDESKPLESINILAAGYIVLMCDTNRKIINVLDRAPRNTAYYKG